MVECNGKIWYWCPNHCYNNKGVGTNGMFVNHKPEDHEQWQKNKDSKLWNRRKGRTNCTESAPINGKPKESALVINDSAASKLFAFQVTSGGIGNYSWSLRRSIQQDFGRCMQHLGKLNGPKCWIESIMDIFIFPVIFSIWAAISILLLFQALLSICTAKRHGNFSIEFIQELYQWIRFLFWITISSYTGRVWGSLIQALFILPIRFYTFFWYVYDFGPKHCKWSLLDILMNPVPGVEFEGWLGEADDFEALRCRQFNHNIVAWHFACTKWFVMKQITKSSVPILHVCHISYINPNAPRLHGYETYYTTYDDFSSKNVNKSEQSMPMMVYFAICNFSTPDIVCWDLPRMPPKRFITSILVNFIIFGIFGIITI